jgi:hypothetical protein
MVLYILTFTFLDSKREDKWQFLFVEMTKIVGYSSAWLRKNSSLPILVIITEQQNNYRHEV